MLRRCGLVGVVLVVLCSCASSSKSTATATTKPDVAPVAHADGDGPLETGARAGAALPLAVGEVGTIGEPVLYLKDGFTDAVIDDVVPGAVTGDAKILGISLLKAAGSTSPGAVKGYPPTGFGAVVAPTGFVVRAGDHVNVLFGMELTGARGGKMTNFTVDYHIGDKRYRGKYEHEAELCNGACPRT